MNSKPLPLELDAGALLRVPCLLTLGHRETNILPRFLKISNPLLLHQFAVEASLLFDLFLLAEFLFFEHLRPENVLVIGVQIFWVLMSMQ